VEKMALKNQIWAKMQGLLGVHDDGTGGTFDVEDEVRQSYEHVMQMNVGLAVTAAANVDTSHFYYAPRDITVLAAAFVPDGTAAAHATNYLTMKIYSGAGTSAATTLVANVMTTPTGAANSMAAGVPFALTVTAAAAEIDAGETLAFEVKKLAAGVALPLGHLVIHYRDR
jgi:hypothetical protein